MIIYHICIYYIHICVHIIFPESNFPIFHSSSNCVAIPVAIPSVHDAVVDLQRPAGLLQRAAAQRRRGEATLGLDLAEGLRKEDLVGFLWEKYGKIQYHGNFHDKMDGLYFFNRIFQNNTSKFLGTTISENLHRCWKMLEYDWIGMIVTI